MLVDNSNTNDDYNNSIRKMDISHLNLLQNIFSNSIYFFNNYNLLYLNSLNKFVIDSINGFNPSKAFNWKQINPFFSSFSYFPNYYMNKWFEATDNEANRLLKSQQFLNNFREYIKSIIKYETFLKEESNNNSFFSINDLDKITDRFQDYLNKEFISFIFNQQTPHKVELQMDTFRLLKYNNQMDNKFRELELKVNLQQQQQQQKKTKIKNHQYH
jgi:hypothetical protein